MDLVQKMNEVVEYIEKNLTIDIDISSLSKTTGYSLHEFSHIFTFIAGMPVSEYIRRRRLSQAVFDIQNGNESLLDIALKYCYESQSAFTRAFKEMHGQTPAAARKNGVLFKTYPKVTFKLIMRGVTEMDFRIVHKESFKIAGIRCNCDFGHWEDFNENHAPRLQASNYFKAPFYLAGAYFFRKNKKDSDAVLIGFELKNEPLPEGYEVETIPATTWAVFSAPSDLEPNACGKTYAKVVSEWFPVSNYIRNEAAPYIEVYANPNGLEIWIPVLKNNN